MISINLFFLIIYIELFLLCQSLSAKYNIARPIKINIEARMIMITSLNNKISNPINIKIIPILKIWSQFKLLLFNINLIIKKSFNFTFRWENVGFKF